MPRIYVYCPDLEEPIGGTKMLYRHVDVLRGLGYEAYALHRSSAFRYGWFSNSTSVLADAQVEWRPSDFLVIPEVISDRIIGNFPIPRKVIFNQNTYHTFASAFSLEFSEDVSPYQDPSLLRATIVVSEDNRSYLNFAFPKHPVFRVHYSVDTSVFFPQEKKKKQIAFMPRKHLSDAVQVFSMLKFKGKLKGFTVKPIDGIPEEEVAKILRESAFFFSFGYPEGCPLPPLEAISCGAVVVGYHGRGGREVLRPEFSYPVEIGDIIEFVTRAEEALALWEGDPEGLREKARLAHHFVADTYNSAREKADIAAIWKELTQCPSV